MLNPEGRSLRGRNEPSCHICTLMSSWIGLVLPGARHACVPAADVLRLLCSSLHTGLLYRVPFAGQEAGVIRSVCFGMEAKMARPTVDGRPLPEARARERTRTCARPLPRARANTCARINACACTHYCARNANAHACASRARCSSHAKCCAHAKHCDHVKRAAIQASSSDAFEARHHRSVSMVGLATLRDAVRVRQH
eukprot:3312852-Pleurochrysis_carterae.AAC.1